MQSAVAGHTANTKEMKRLVVVDKSDTIETSLWKWLSSLGALAVAVGSFDKIADHPPDLDIGCSCWLLVRQQVVVAEAVVVEGEQQIAFDIAGTKQFEAVDYSLLLKAHSVKPPKVEPDIVDTN